MTLPLDRYVTVTLDSNGNGTAMAGPQRVREHWQLLSVTPSVAAPVVKTASCSVYIGTSVNAGQLVSQTAFGSQGQTCGLGNQDIPTGYQVFIVWAGGDAGKVATAHVVGTYTIGAPK
jgi:hypothetical protein